MKVQVEALSEDYYSTCPFPKSMGEPKKTKKKHNGYKDKPNRKCFYTGLPGAERHEVFPGPNRQISIDHGFQVDVCREIHQALQYGTTEWAKEEDLRWKMHYQRQYEDELLEKGLEPAEARKKWMTMIGKNYL